MTTSKNCLSCKVSRVTLEFRSHPSITSVQSVIRLMNELKKHMEDCPGETTGKPIGEVLCELHQYPDKLFADWDAAVLIVKMTKEKMELKLRIRDNR